MAKKTPKSGIEHLKRDRINWFPGHMNKAVIEIKKNIKLVNILVEVRDARAPMASGNKDSYKEYADKPYLIVFNKTNLADPEATERWQTWLDEQGESFIFINALDKVSFKEITKKAKAIVHAHRQKSNPDVAKKNDLKMMVIGLPNTGKSTIINKLSHRNATKAASKPGQTKTKLWVKADKNLSILDTPGVMPPRIDKQIHAKWLSAVHAIPDHIISPEDSACFVIEFLLKKKVKTFQEYYKLESLDITLLEVLDHIGKLRGCLGPGGSYDYEHIYKIVIGDFRKGTLGLFTFELPPIK